MGWLRRTLDIGSVCLQRNPVGTGGWDGHPGYACTKRRGHRGSHAWVGHESTPNAVWGGGK